MKTSLEIVHIVASSIGHIYFRPEMYGGSPEGVDLLLHHTHGLWAEIMERGDNLMAILMEVSSEQGCGSRNFAGTFARRRPFARPEEATDYVVQQWKKISERLEISVPYTLLAQAFADNPSIMDRAHRNGIHPLHRS